MKLKLTILMENDKPLSESFDTNKEAIRKTYQMFFDVFTRMIADDDEKPDKATVLSVEVVEE